MRPRSLLGALIGLPLGLAGIGVAYQTNADAEFARRAQPTGQLVTVDGRRMHVLCQGTGMPTVILEASGPGTLLQYDHVLVPLATETTVCAYDRAGLGFSDPVPRDRTAQELANDLWTTLLAAHVGGPYVLVASSFGGLDVELLARERPKEVVGVVLLDALTSENVTDPALDDLKSKACLARWAAQLGLMRATDPFHLAKADPISFGLTYRAQTWKTVCAELEALPETADELKSVAPLRDDLPLTVITHGEPRGFLPMASPEQQKAAEPRWQESQKRFAAKSKRGKLVVAAGSGHLIAEEKPDLVVAEVRAVIAQARAAGPAAAKPSAPPASP